MPTFNIRPDTGLRRRNFRPSPRFVKGLERQYTPTPWQPRPRTGPYVPRTPPEPPRPVELPLPHTPANLVNGGFRPYIPPSVLDPSGGRISAALRAFQFYNDWENYVEGGGPMTRSLVWYNYQKVESCGGGGGPVSRTQSWPSCNPAGFAFNPSTAGNYTPNYNARVYVWGDATGQKVGNSVYYKPGFSLLPQTGYKRVGHFTVPQMRPMPHPDLRPDLALHPDAVTAPALPIPRLLAPYRARQAVHRNVGYGLETYSGHTGTGLSPVSGARAGFAPATARPVPTPDPLLPGETTTSRRHLNVPGPKVRERKARVPGWVMTALRASHTVGEVDDALDALFDALPKDIQKRVPRSGRTKRGAKIGEGKAYLTPYDKAKALARYWRYLDLSEAIWNLIKNEVIDRTLGRANAGADNFSNKRLGGARFI